MYYVCNDVRLKFLTVFDDVLLWLLCGNLYMLQSKNYSKRSSCFLTSQIRSLLHRFLYHKSYTLSLLRVLLTRRLHSLEQRTLSLMPTTTLRISRLLRIKTFPAHLTGARKLVSHFGVVILFLSKIKWFSLDKYHRQGFSYKIVWFALYYFICHFDKKTLDKYSIWCSFFTNSLFARCTRRVKCLLDLLM